MEAENAGGGGSAPAATNGGAHPDTRSQLAPLIRHSQRALGTLNQLHLTVSSFSTTSQLSIFDRLNSLMNELAEMEKAAQDCDIQVPLEVIGLIDEGKNPDEFTKEIINRCVQKNQTTKGKSEAFKNLRKELLDELEKDYPEEMEAYREMRAASYSEAIKQMQAAGSLPNGDTKTKTQP